LIKQADTTVKLNEKINVNLIDENIQYQTLVKTTYHDGHVALVLTNQPHDIESFHLGEDDIILTVNIVNMGEDTNLVTIDVNNRVVVQVLPELVEQGLLDPTPYPDIPSGFVNYPIYKTYI